MPFYQHSSGTTKLSILPGLQEDHVEVAEEDNSHLPLLERRQRRANAGIRPIRFRDEVPQSLSALPPPQYDTNTISGPEHLASTVNGEGATVPDNPVVISIGQRIRRILTTPRNAFGLFRQYLAEKIPSHDPEEHIDLKDLSNSSAQPKTTFQNEIHPYPNRNSFLLGDWYWNNGVQKSQSSFKELLEIVGDSTFRPQDISDTNWSRVNAELAADNLEEEWLDEDAGWTKDTITIAAPFHRLTDNPGPQNYVAGDFHHRNIVSVIKEKLADRAHQLLFHYDPYELHWQAQKGSPPIRVHGELYTSPVFIRAHDELQESPPEPGCTRPRVIIGLMFSSDVTHLTSFSDSKLWPLYMYCGNESKYRRCKPSCHLCSHIAYFEKVCHSL